MLFNTVLRTFVLVTVASFLLSQSTFGQDQWINPFGGLYHSPFNWQDTTPPGATESALFGLDDTYTVVWNSTTGNTFSTRILVPQGDVTFRGVGPDRTYTISDDVELSGGDLTLGESTDPLDLVIADALRVQGGSQLDVRFGSDVDLNGQLLIGSIGGDGTVVVDGLGSTFINSSTNNVIIGATGNSGSLYLNNSAFASINASLNLVASNVTGSVGTVNVLTGAEMVIAGDFNLLTGSGNNQIGTFYTGGGTILVDGNLNIGTGTGSSQYSSFLISSDSLFVQTAEGTIDIGGVETGGSSARFETDGDGEFVSGTGSITIHTSGYITNQGTFTANGPVAIENGGELIIEGGEFEATTGLENSDAGTIDIRNGTLTISGGHFDAPRVNGSTSFLISGTAPGDLARLALVSGATGNVGRMIVGHNGTDGELEVSGGATLSTAPFPRFGNSPGSTATVTVSGTGSSLLTDAAMFGFEGTATFEILDGGRVTNSRWATVGYRGEGTIRVWGEGSLLETSNWLDVGSFGTGVLSIQNGGEVRAPRLLIGSESTGEGRVNVAGVGRVSALTIDEDVFVAGDETTASGGIGLLSSGGHVVIGGRLMIWDTGEVIMNGPLTSHFLSASVIDNSNGGTFDFRNGTLQVDSFFGDLVNQGLNYPGRLAPGPGAGPTAITGNYTQQSGAILDMEIGGTSQGGTHDVVTVTGVASLDGQLELSLINGFLPEPDDEFIMLSAGSINGFFDNIFNGQRLDVTGGEGSFVVNYGVGSAFPTNQIVLSDFQPNVVVVEPVSFVVTRGQYVSGDETDLAASDNADLSLRRLGSDIQSRTEFEVKSTSPIATPTSFEFTLEGAAFARSNVVQTIELYDYVAAAWELVDTRNAVRSPAPDSVVTVAATGDLSRFVEAGTRCIESRVRYQSDNPRQNFASNTDRTAWTIE